MMRAATALIMRKLDDENTEDEFMEEPPTGA
jgi:hypothetical protein